MAKAPAHKNRTKTAQEMTFAEQAKSISATCNNLYNLLRRHIKNSPKPQETRVKCHRQIESLNNRVKVL